MLANRDAIRALIKEHGWTVTRFAEEIKMSRVKVSDVLNNRENPGAKFISSFMKRFPDRDMRVYFSA